MALRTVELRPHHFHDGCLTAVVEENSVCPSCGGQAHFWSSQEISGCSSEQRDALFAEAAFGEQRIEDFDCEHCSQSK
jgi:hypothetical protein